MLDEPAVSEQFLGPDGRSIIGVIPHFAVLCFTHRISRATALCRRCGGEVPAYIGRHGYTPVGLMVWHPGLIRTDTYLMPGDTMVPPGF